VEFEVIRAIITVFQDHEDLVRLALNKLNGFLDSNDPNCNTHLVKYLGLVALEHLISLSPQLSEEYRIFILEALQSKDLTIRLRSLRIVKLTATNETLPEIINNLLNEVEKPANASIKEDITGCILYLLSLNQYELVVDFRWMFEILLKIVLIKTQTHEAQLSSIILDVVLRVEDLREEACEMSLELLEKFDGLKSERCESLTALLFIIGEFCALLSQENLVKGVNLLLKPRWDSVNFHENVYNAISSCLFKIGWKVEGSVKDQVIARIKSNCAVNDHMEAQERSLLYLNLLKTCEPAKIEFIFKPFLPIHPLAQSLLAPPEDLLKEFEVDQNELMTVKEDGTVEYHYYRDEDFKDPQMSDIERKLAKMRIKEKQMQDPFYIKSKKGKKKKGKKGKGKMGGLGEEKKEEEGEKKEEVEVKEQAIARPTKKYSVNRTDPLVPK